MNSALLALLGARGGASAVAASYNYLTAQSSTPAETQFTFTFANLALGTAAANRTIIIGIGTSGHVPSSVTVGGVAATAHHTYIDQPNQSAAGIYSAVVPSGATGDVVVAFGNSAFRCAVALWAAYGSLAYGVGGSGGFTGASVTLTAPANALCIAVFDTNQQSTGLGGVTVRGAQNQGNNPRTTFGDAQPPPGSHTVTTDGPNYYTSLVVADFTLT